ncbi:M42 family metallopeptidase [Clostridium sp.]|uniref:M42 family metallopeptidase n=1 Tax=Clostridium sp. TaxID=1506 RepID=UPI003464B95D
MNKLFEDLIGAFGVSGHEEEIRSVIVEQLSSLGVENKVDNMGNVIVALGKSNVDEEKKVMISSHMDTMGFIVMYIEDNGFLRIGKVGEFDESAFVNNMVEFENGNSGRVCGTKDNPKIDDMYIDLGVESRDEALELVREGDVCTITSNVIEEEKNIIAPALDNRVGCYMSLKAIEKLIENKELLEELDKEIYFVFSTQNTLGGRGARAAAYEISPMYALVIDGENAGDTLGGSGKFSLGKGTGIKFMDRTLLMHHEVKEQLEKVYEKMDKKPHYIFGETQGDGKTIHKEGVGVKTGTLVYPVRYKDTNMEMVNYKDIEEGIEVIYSYIIE